MTAVRYSDYADTIRYALTPQVAGMDVDIVLDLFRGPTALSQTLLARVRRRDAEQVMRRCRDHLERQGLHAVLRAVDPSVSALPETPDPRLSLPVAAFDWMFAAG